MNVPVPSLAILVVPPSVNAPAVIATLPVVAVNPLLSVNNPADVMVPVPDVDMFPLVVMSSPAVRGETVVPTLCQYWVNNVPFAVTLPEQVKLPLAPSTVQPVADEPPAMFTLVAVAPVGPMFNAVVAPPPKLMVVAVVLSRSKLVLPVVKDVATLGDVIAGALLNTTTPPVLPVSSVRDDARTEDAADVVTLLDASRNKARLAVNAERLMVASAREVVPVPTPRVSVPVPLASSVRPVLVVDGDITGFAPENVKAVEVNVLVLMV